jgi:hypothetical protein
MTEMSVLIRMSVGINEGTKRVKGHQTETAPNIGVVLIIALIFNFN